MNPNRAALLASNLDSEVVINALEKMGYSVSVNGTKSLTLTTDPNRRDWRGMATFHVFIDSVNLKVSLDCGDSTVVAMVEPTSIRLAVKQALGLIPRAIVSSNPIEAAVMPLKNDAIKRASEYASERIKTALESLAANNWDVSIVAPRPDSLRTDRSMYLKMMAYNNFVVMITMSGAHHESHGYRLNAPNIRLKSISAEEKYINQCKQDAGDQYDKFVAKLVAKIGACDTATLQGNHVWGYSILTATSGAITEHWKTQQIINVSKNGLLFNQWPTRKVKQP